MSLTKLNTFSSPKQARSINHWQPSLPKQIWQKPNKTHNLNSYSLLTSIPSLLPFTSKLGEKICLEEQLIRNWDFCVVKLLILLLMKFAYYDFKEQDWLCALWPLCHSMAMTHHPPLQITHGLLRVSNHAWLITLFTDFHMLYLLL